MDELFTLRCSLKKHFSEFQSLRSNNPERFKYLLELGEQLLECSAKGQMRKFQQLLLGKTKEDMLPYFVVKMIEGALIQGHLMLAGFIIDHGYIIRYAIPGVPSVVHNALRVVDDNRASEIAKFVVLKGFDINLQESVTFDTLLHICVRRKLINACYILVNELNADVNAVAKADVMPLQVANAIISVSEEDESNILEIIRLLEQKGAKSTWRHDKIQAHPTATKSDGVSMVRFSSLSLNSQQPSAGSLSALEAMPTLATWYDEPAGLTLTSTPSNLFSSDSSTKPIMVFSFPKKGVSSTVPPQASVQDLPATEKECGQLTYTSVVCK